jgi:hypothetical protein
VRKKIVKYIPKPLPNLSVVEAEALEKKLRNDIDSWARLQAPDTQGRLKRFRIKIVQTLFPQPKARKHP